MGSAGFCPSTVGPFGLTKQAAAFSKPNSELRIPNGRFRKLGVLSLGFIYRVTITVL